MKAFLPIVIVVATAALVAMAWVQSGGLAMHEMRSAGTPQEAVEALMTDIQARDWDRAYARLANNADVEKPAFIHDLSGTDGSLRTYSALQSFNVWPIQASSDDAVMLV